MSAKRKQPADGLARKPNETGLGGEGGNGFARDRVVDIQRTRMLAAMTQLSSERGAGNVSVAHVVERSGVSRRTFYEIFTDREDCFLAAFDDAIARVAEQVVPVYEQPNKWRERVRGALIELLSFLDNDPVTGRLVIVETLGAGPRALERRGKVLVQILAAVDAGRSEVKAGSQPPPLTAEGVVGAVLSVVHSRMLDEAQRPLLSLANELMSMIVLPYLGSATARRELEGAIPRPRPATSARPDPLATLGMRLTYRTMRVLIAVAEHPGASNRGVAEASGIADQGQMSKLLSRLVSLGLIENSATGPTRGKPNAWRLTEKGRALQRAL